MDNKGNNHNKENKQISVELPFVDRLKLLFGSGVIIILIFLIFKYLFFYVWPFLLAYIIAIAIEKPVNKLSKHLWNKKGLASTIIIIFLTKLLIYGLGFFIAIKVSWINIITVFLGYFIIKITIYIDTYRQDRLDKIKNN